MSNQRTQTSQRSHLIQRKKFHSVRSLINQHLEPTHRQLQTHKLRQLQRLLQEQNKQEQPVAQPPPTIPGYDDIQVQNRLWLFFESRMAQVNGKVEWEQVNKAQRLFWQIKRQVQQKSKSNQRGINTLQALIKDRYKQVHSIFEEIRLMGTEGLTTTTTGRRKKKNAPALVPNQKLQSLKETVLSLKKEVEEFQKQLTSIQLEQAKIEKQWLNVLKRMLKEQHYLRQGMTEILKQMTSLGYRPTMDDFPPILDKISKECLIAEYEMHRKGKFERKYSPRRSKAFSQSVPKHSLTQILQKDLTRDIYKGTQDFVSSLIKQPIWKKDSLTLHKLSAHTKGSLLPKLSASTPKQRPGGDWRKAQLQRIQHAYDNRAIKHKVRSILVGPKVDSV